MATNAKKVFAVVANELGESVLTAAPEASHIEGFVSGVLLCERVSDVDEAYVLMYEQRSEGWGGNKPQLFVRGMTGFVSDGKRFNFDQRGIGDSWYPDMDQTPQDIVAKMQEQLKQAKERWAAYVKRKAEGTVINFGPTTRTLLPKEIAEFKATLKAGRSFSLNPSGMGTGYRFYVGRAINRYGEGVPASAEARKLLGQDRLVYDRTDHD